MKRSVWLTAVLTVALAFTAARPALAMRDVGGASGQYGDGMNLYQYVHSAPPNGVDPKGTAAAWTKQQVLDIVCCCAPEVVDRINRINVKVFSHTSRQYTEVTYQEAGGTKTEVGRREMVEGGYSSPGKIVIAAEKSPEQVVALIAHEGFHGEFSASQRAAYIRQSLKANPRADLRQLQRLAEINHEANTWVYEESVRIKCNIAQKMDNFRKWREVPGEYQEPVRQYYEAMKSEVTGRASLGKLEAGFKVPNSTVITATVEDLYKYTYGAPPGITVEEKDTVPAGPEIDTGGWKCPGKQS